MRRAHERMMAAEAEQIVAASLVWALEDEDVPPEDLEGLDPDDVADPDLALIVREALRLRAAGGKSPGVLVAQNLRQAGHTRAADRVFVLASYADVPARFSVWRESIRAAATWRAIARLGREAQAAPGQDMDLAEALDGLDARVQALRWRHARRHREMRAAEGLGDIGERPAVLLRFGLPWFDDLLGGIEPGSSLIIAGATSAGKSAFASQLMLEAAKGGMGGTYLSVEMGARAIFERLLAQHTGLDSMAIRTACLPPEGRERLLQAKREIAGMPIRFVDMAGATPAEALAAAQRAFRTSRLVVLDYLQIVRGSEERREEMDMLSSGFRALARQHGGISVLLSQFRRQPAGYVREPGLSDLKESSGLEQDADAIVLLYPQPQKAPCLPAGRNGETMPVTAVLAKNRIGPTGRAEVCFHRRCLRLERAVAVPQAVPWEAEDTNGGHAAPAGRQGGPATANGQRRREKDLLRLD